MAITQSSVVSLVEERDIVAAPTIDHDAYEYPFRDRWRIRARSGRPWFVLADAIAIAVAISATAWWSAAHITFAILVFAMCITWARVGDRIAVSGLDHAARVFASIAIAHLAAEIVNRSALSLSTVGAVLFAILLARSAAVYVLRALRARRYIGERVLVLGSDDEAIADVLRAHPELGMVPVPVSALADGTGMLVDLEDAEVVDAVLHEHQMRRVFVDRDVLSSDVWGRIGSRVELCCVLPNPDGLPVAYRVDDHLWGLPIARVWCRVDARPAWRVKRALDISCALLGIVVTAPLTILVSLAVRATSRGPVLLRQQRVGRNGQVINVTKFRTMRHVDKPLEIDLRDGQNPAERQRLQHEEANSRVTMLGRVLRATSIDELPQLFDVLRGDLSLTGPRPELPIQAAHYGRTIDGYAARHRVVGGLSGWSQIHGLRGDTPLKERARFDNYYIDTWSFGRDLKIVLWTAVEITRHVARVTMRRGARSEDSAAGGN